MQSAYIVSHGTNLNYYRTGSGLQPLVLVHGITDDALCWSSVAEALSDEFDIIMVDQRGHGKSEAPEGGYIYENLATELAGLIELLDLEPTILLGHSLGAFTSLVLAGLFPNVPRAVVLVDPPAFWCHDPADIEGIETRKAFAEWFQSIKRKTKEELVDEAVDKGWAETDQKTWVDAKQRVSPRAIELIAPADILTFDFPDLVSRIECPVLLVHGDPDRGAICTDEDAAELRAILPTLQMVQIPNGTHSIHRSQFAPFLKAVEQFLSEVLART